MMNRTGGRETTTWRKPSYIPMCSNGIGGLRDIVDHPDIPLAASDGHG